MRLPYASGPTSEFRQDCLGNRLGGSIVSVERRNPPSPKVTSIGWFDNKVELGDITWPGLYRPLKASRTGPCHPNKNRSQ
jgi:hypothetical protein